MSTSDTTKTFVKQFNTAYKDTYINEISTENMKKYLKILLKKDQKFVKIFLREIKNKKLVSKIK